jgi:hypothetical protein
MTTHINNGTAVTRVPAWLLNRDNDLAGERSDPRTRPLTDPELAAVAGVALATFVLGVIGLFNSFRSVAEAAEPSFGTAAWTVPLAVDIGVLVFSALDLVLARLDMRVAWLRLLPWGLVAVTIYLNVADQATWFGRIAHAVLPALWVVAVEVGTHAVRTRAGLGSERRLDRIRISRWLLAPVATVGLWRRMVLWEIRAYPDALARERDRLLAKTHLQDAYGRISWRWKAPRRDRALYRLGELAPDTTDIATAAVPSITSTHTTAPAMRKPTSMRRTHRTSKARSRRTVPDVSDLLTAADTAAARIASRGEDLTRKSLAAQLRTDGHQVGNAKLGALLDHLRTTNTTSSTSAASAGTTSSTSTTTESSDPNEEATA